MIAQETLVCNCKKVSLGTIQDYLAKNSRATVQDIMDATGAGTGCGSCKDSSKGKELNLEAIIAAKGNL